MDACVTGQAYNHRPGHADRGQAATAFMIAYVASQWHHIDASVMIAYFTSVVVQSIGILYVITKYLFPQSGPQRDSASGQT